MPTINATPADPAANCYLTHAEANAYFEERLPLVPAWVTSGQEAALIMATRVVDMVMRPGRRWVPVGDKGYFVQRRAWTGTSSTQTQKLAWPRQGMLTQNGVAIPSGEVPYELKCATAELAGQLLKADRTLDSDVAVQGLTSLKAGSVSLGFREAQLPQVLPDAVLELLVPSWYNEEVILPQYTAEIAVLGGYSIEAFPNRNG